MPPSAHEQRRVAASQARRLLELRLQTRIPRSTFYRWLHSGLLPAHKLVSKYLITLAAIERFASEAKW